MNSQFFGNDNTALGWYKPLSEKFCKIVISPSIGIRRDNDLSSFYATHAGDYTFPTGLTVQYFCNLVVKLTKTPAFSAACNRPEKNLPG